MKKLLFQLIFSTYLPMVLLKFQLATLIGWGIQFRIQRVPTWHTFGGPRSMKDKKYMKKCDAKWVLVGCGIESINITFFHVSLVFRGTGSTKRM